MFVLYTLIESSSWYVTVLSEERTALPNMWHRQPYSGGTHECLNFIIIIYFGLKGFLTEICKSNIHVKNKAAGQTREKFLFL